MLKSNLRKFIAVALVIILSAAGTITGIAVSAASHSNAATPDTVEQIDDLSQPALKDGTWNAEYADGTVLRFVISSEEDSFAILDPEMGIGVPGRYEYIPEIGMYKISFGGVGDELYWLVIDNSGDTAVVSNEVSELIYLTYLSESTEI